MCGIFGYVGERTSAAILVEALKRLEYRGYDSWGVAIGSRETAGAGLQVVRKAGRIASDGVSVKSAAPGSAAPWGGIAHTRWATHGPPTDVNAHPHRSRNGRIAVVHNGIIENYRALRQMLEADGYPFVSETDTEVIPHLVEKLMTDGADFRTAFLGTLELLDGTYGIAAICADEPGLILAGRMGSPMVIGIGQKAMMVASDPAALIAHTRNVIYLDDGDTATLRADSFETHDLQDAPVTKDVQEIAFDLPSIERNGHPHFMLKEIFEQPETIRNAFRGRIVRGEGSAHLGGIRPEVMRRARRCHIISCGTSWHAALVGKYLIENLARIPTQVSYAAEFRYANPIIEPDTLVIAISQSGETADTLAGVREALLRGADTIGICNTVGSSIARECGQGVYIHAGPEIGVASTKAFTSQLVVLSLLAVHLGRMRGMALHDAIQLLDAIEQLPAHAESALQCNAEIRELAREYADAPNFLYVGRLYEYPVALEGALKLKEISYIHAEGIPAAELKHGPIALVDEQMPTVVLAAQSGILDKMKSNVEEIRARGGRILAVARHGEAEIPRLAEHTIAIPAVPDPLVPILAVIPLQLLAYHIAVLRGCDVDRPRNLAKSVTVE